MNTNLRLSTAWQRFNMTTWRLWTCPRKEVSFWSREESSLILWPAGGEILPTSQALTAGVDKIKRQNLYVLQIYWNHAVLVYWPVGQIACLVGVQVQILFQIKGRCKSRASFKLCWKIINNNNKVTPWLSLISSPSHINREYNYPLGK